MKRQCKLLLPYDQVMLTDEILDFILTPMHFQDHWFSVVEFFREVINLILKL